MLHSFWHRCLGRWKRQAFAVQAVHRPSTVPLCLEQLEARLAPATTFSIANNSQIEPAPNGTVNLDFTVTRAGDLTSQVTVGYTTVSGTAQPGADFTPMTGVTTFASGSATALIAIPIFGNDVYDSPNLSFSVQLTGITNVIGSPVTFGAQNDVVSNTEPISAAAADLNGDGKPDLVVTYGFQDTASVLLNTTPAGATTPTFGAPMSIAAAQYPSAVHAVAIADVNGDGLPDLVVLDQLGTRGYVSVLLNKTTNGALSFASQSSQSTFAVGNDYSSLAVADLNGDGKPDIVVAGYGGSVSVLANTTTTGATIPAFSPVATYAVDAGSESVAIADLNGDGQPDIVTADRGSKDVSVLLNTTTNGVLSFASQQTFAAGTQPGSVAVADLNGDGKTDIVVANYGDGTVSVLLNTTTNGVFSFASQTTFAAGKDPIAVAVADLNGDGKPDIIVANSYFAAYSISVLMNTTTQGAAPSFAPLEDFPTNTAPRSLAIADLDGDGRPDLVITASNEANYNVATLLNTTMLGAPYAITEATAVGTIIESDPEPTVQFSTASETVNASTGAFSITVALSAVSGADTTIPFTLGGTAVADQDYSGVTGSPLVIAAGQTTATITGTLLEDGANTFKTLTFTLGTPTNAVLGGTTTITLTIDEPAALNLLVNGAQTTANVPVVAVGDAFDLGGTFIDRETGPLHAVITWGDGAITNAAVTVSNQQGVFDTTHVYTQEGSYPVSAVIEDSQGQIVAVGALSGPVQVVPVHFGPVDVVFAVPGQTVTQSVTDPATGTVITVSLTLPAGDAASGYLLVTELDTLVSSSASGIAQYVASFDVRQFNLSDNATAVVSFALPGQLPAGTTGQLLYLDRETDPTHPTEKVFQGPTQFFQGPSVQFGINQFTTPKLTDLTGTVFTIAASLPSTTTTTGISPAVASTASNASVPIRTATFQTTSTVTLALEPSQASQVSSSLATFTMDAGGGGGGQDDASGAASALFEFLLDEFDFLPRLLFPHKPAGSGGPGASAPPASAPTAPETSPAHTEQQDNVSALDLFLRDPAPPMGWFTAPPSLSDLSPIRRRPRKEQGRPAETADKIAIFTVAAGVGVAISGAGQRRKNGRFGGAL